MYDHEKRRKGWGTFVVIEGVKYPTLGHLLKEAQKRGYDGSEKNLVHRIKRGVSDWKQLAKPINQSRAVHWRTYNEKARQEMAQVIADLDARKSGGHS